MNRISKILVMLLAGGLMVAGSVKAVLAGPKLTLTPVTREVDVSEVFPVVVGVASGTEKVLAVDLWAVFDAAKLEVVSVEAVNSPAFIFAMGDKNIDNSKGTLSVPLMPSDLSGLAAEVANGGLVTVNFKAKVSGTASFSFTCESGSVVDSNIMSPDGDIIDCAANDSGLYTVKAGAGGDGGSTPTPTPTTSGGVANPTARPTSASALPQTGSMGDTVMLLVGAVLALILGVAVIKI